LLLLFTVYGAFSVGGLYDWYVLPFAIASVYLIARLAQAAAQRLPSGMAALTGRRMAHLLMAGIALVVLARRTSLELAVVRDATYDVRDRAERLGRLGDQFPRATFAGWNAGFSAYALGGRLTNLDGLVSDAHYADTVLSRSATFDFVLEQRFDFIVDYAPRLQMPRAGDARLWAGMTSRSYERLIDTYDLCEPIEPPLNMIILIRRASDRVHCEPRRPLSPADFRWLGVF